MQRGGGGGREQTGEADSRGEDRWPKRMEVGRQGEGDIEGKARVGGEEGGRE